MYAVGSSGIILHFDGSTWSEMESPTTENILRLWGNSANDIYAVGDNGIILHFDGNSWEAIQTPTSDDLFGVYGIATEEPTVMENNIYAVGAGGTILLLSLPKMI